MNNEMDLMIYKQYIELIYYTEMIVKKYPKIEKIVNDDNIVKLFYQNSKKYDIKNVNNWGNSKGNTYIDTCVILNKNSYEMYQKHKLNELPPSTKNKLYVALSRATNNVYIVDERKINKYKKTN